MGRRAGEILPNLKDIAEAVRALAERETWDLLVHLDAHTLYVAEAHPNRSGNRWSVTLTIPHQAAMPYSGRRFRVAEERRFDGELTRTSIGVLAVVTPLLPFGGLSWGGTTE